MVHRFVLVENPLARAAKCLFEVPVTVNFGGIFVTFFVVLFGVLTVLVCLTLGADLCCTVIS